MTAQKDGARVLIAGCGALGSVFGAFLRRAGCAVTLFGRAPHLDAVESSGLRIDGLWGEHLVRGFGFARSARDLRGEFDAVFLAVKSYDTRAMAESIAAHVAPQGVVVSLQNGLGNVEIIESVVGAEHSLAARVIFGAVLPRPGHARVTVYADPSAIGALRPGVHPALDAMAQRWSTIIAGAGVPAVYSDRVSTLLWAKVFYNAALNPLGALLGVHYGRLAERPDSRAVMDAVIDEAYAVARGEGIELPWPDAADYRREFYGRLVPATHDHRSSMLQDLERGRRTEVDAINGAIWQGGAKHHIPTPINEMLTRVMRLKGSDT